MSHRVFPSAANLHLDRRTLIGCRTCKNWISRSVGKRERERKRRANKEGHFISTIPKYLNVVQMQLDNLAFSGREVPLPRRMVRVAGPAAGNPQLFGAITPGAYADSAFATIPAGIFFNFGFGFNFSSTRRRKRRRWRRTGRVKRKKWRWRTGRIKRRRGWRRIALWQTYSKENK